MMKHARFWILIFLLCIGCGSPVSAAVEIGLLGEEVVTLEDVYYREGTAFLDVDAVLEAFGMDGDWDSVEHVYRIRTPHGWMLISPGSQFLRMGENIVPIAHRPRFIDGKLRVSEAFVRRQLSPFLPAPVFYRNLNPPESEPERDPLDRLFSFLLRKKEPVEESSRWVVAIDPGHGGQDPGVLAPDGSKEKAVNLAVAQRLEKLLKMHQDAPVLMTRDNDYAVPAEKRLLTVAEGGADVLLSLHAQGFIDSSARGIRLYVQPETERDAPDGLVGENASLQLARALRASFAEGGFAAVEIAQRPVLPLGRGDLPRVLIEMGSLSNPDDLVLLKDPARQQDLARALFNGLQRFFKQTKEATHDVPFNSTQ